MKLFFARHGESEANVAKIFCNVGSGFGLTQKGRDQAALMAQSLEAEGLTRVISSPLLRAQNTAEIVCARIGLAFQTEPALQEFSVGSFEGQPEVHAAADYRELERAWLSEGNLNASIGGGECFHDIQARFVPFIDDLKRKMGSTDERILLVGHGGTFACMLPVVLENVSHDFAQEHPFSPATYVKAQGAEDELVCIQWGDHILAPSG